MKEIAVVTSNRAEYGILTPLLKRIDEDDDLSLSLLVTGAHLSPKYGYTAEQIKEDGFNIAASVPILEEGNSAKDISTAIANAIKEFAEIFSNHKPDILVLLGDRTELLGAAIAAMNENILIAHIHGGEITEGAVDDCVRHALTKMSYLHFAGTEVYRKRIIQMGEDPARVFNVGTLGAENILRVPLMKEAEIREYIGIPNDKKYAVVTLHSETVDQLPPKSIAGLLCECMESNTEYFYVITASNSDVGGDRINEIFTKLADSNENITFKYSLGMKRYLSAVKYAAFVLGNSSSGIIEAPILGVPTINIGNRQCGRIMSETIINVPFDKREIMNAISRVREVDRKPTTLYGNGDASAKIVSVLKDYLSRNIDKKKGFYDMPDV